MPIDFSQFQKKEPRKIVQEPIIASPIEDATSIKQKPKITVKRGSITKNQLMNNINRIHKEDQKLTRGQQRIPAEVYRTFEIVFRTLKGR